MTKRIKQIIFSGLAIMILLSLFVIPPAKINRIASQLEKSHKRFTHHAAQKIKLPINFEANLGQFDPAVKFAARNNNYKISLTESEAIMELDGAARLVMKQMGGNIKPKISGINLIAAKSNYILASNSAHSITNIPNYTSVKYEEVYPQIDLIYYGNEQQLEYDFIVAPGANPDQIKLIFEGARNIAIDSTGDLIIETSAGEVRQHCPTIYQESDGSRKEISGHYTLSQNSESESQNPVIGFEVSDYDRSRPLIIDPVVSYSTYLGGSSADEAQAIAVDEEGCTYIIGHTLSINFPTVNPLQPLFKGPAAITDVFVAKLNAQGTALIYSTYIGGSGADYGQNIAVDTNSNIYITGYSTSIDFPTTAGVFQSTSGGGDDTFVAKLNAEGTSLIYSTYLGGTGVERGNAIATDEAGHAYVAGKTTSLNFPVTSEAFQQTIKGFEDAFVTKINAEGTEIVYSTYLGGNSGLDEANDLAIDSQGNLYLTGGTASTNFPTTEEAFQKTFGGGTVFFGDGYVTKINSSGSSLIYSTYLGGARGDQCRGITIDSSGHAYVTGTTESDNFPTLKARQSAKAGECVDIFSNCNDAFVTKLNPSGSALIYSTYLGGGSRGQTPLSAGDSGSAIAVDQAGNVYIAGTTTSDDFPVVRAFQNAKAGHGDVFIARISSTGSDLSYSTYVGGVGDESASGIAIDQSGNIYVTGIATSTGFPTTDGSLQPLFAGSFESFVIARDGFVFRIASDVPRITAAFIVRKKLFITGENFEMGAELFINGKRQKKIVNDISNPTRLLVAKKSGNKVPRGQIVTLMVRNPGGTTSVPFLFARED